MAFIKNPLNGVDQRTIVGYSDDLENRIEDGINGVVESGSNSNGNWVKFDDGTMICTKRVVLSGGFNANTAWGTLFYSGTASLGNLPVSFITPPIMSYNFYPDTESWAWVMSASNPRDSNSGAGRVVFVRPTTGVISGAVEVTAIGRWK